MKSRKNGNDRRRLMLKCAKLYGSEPYLVQTEIAQRLELAQPTVSRLLDEATKAGFLVTAPRFEASGLSDAERRSLEEELSPAPDLVRRIREGLPPKYSFEIHIFDAVEPGDFAQAAAIDAFTLLARCRTVGVSMGRTLAALIEAMKQAAGHRMAGQSGSIECLPVCGDCVFLMNQESQSYSASSLAAKLEKVFVKQRKSDLPSLTGVPAYIPSRLAEDKHIFAKFREYVESFPGHERIFKADPTSGQNLVSQLDGLLTGVGIIAEGEEDGDEVVTGACIRERLIQEKNDKSTMAPLVFGDMGGILLPRDGLSNTETERVETWNEGWMGIKEKDVLETAERARSNGTPGVILVAGGAAKAELLHRVVSKGLVNHLLIDKQLAAALAARAHTPPA